MYNNTQAASCMVAADELIPSSVDRMMIWLNSLALKTKRVDAVIAARFVRKNHDALQAHENRYNAYFAFKDDGNTVRIECISNEKRTGFIFGATEDEHRWFLFTDMTNRIVRHLPGSDDEALALLSI